jgi:hypothetical protein
MNALIVLHAFCGFYVAGAGDKLYNHATQVVLMRAGTRTVLSMQNNYQGPAADFAMVVPVPVVLQKEDVKTLPRDVFTTVETLDSPRLVEYWEQDPCKPHAEAGSYGTIGHGSGTGVGYGVGRGESHVKVEAEFTVAEYEIVILSADDALALDGWLHDHGYKIPDGAAQYLKPYVTAGSKFFVAKVDAKKVTFDKDGQTQLSPLRFHYDSDQFSLPIRLGLINSDGTQDLIVHILSPGTRYEVANYPNVTIPTNLEVADGTKDRFAEVYAALFDDTLAKHQGAVVTEYAWSAATCDPCPGPPLDEKTTATLGGDVMSDVTGGTPGAKIGAIESDGVDKEIVRRLIRQHLSQISYCYEKQLAAKPGIAGTLTLELSTDIHGLVHAKASGVDPDVDACVAGVAKTIDLPKPGKGAMVSASVPIAMSPTMNSGRMTSWVLTRLHARYSKDTLGDDLVFKPAEAIVGGREQRGADGKLEVDATPSTYNNFQARYVIRHPWTGAVDCKNPVRGIWGENPNGQGAGEIKASAASNLAFAPRGKIELSAYVSGGAGAGAGVKTAPPPATVSVPKSDTAATTGKDEKTEKKNGCGCVVGGREDHAPWFGVLMMLVLALGIRGRARGSR